MIIKIYLFVSIIGVFTLSLFISLKLNKLDNSEMGISYFAAIYATENDDKSGFKKGDIIVVNIKLIGDTYKTIDSEWGLPHIENEKGKIIFSEPSNETKTYDRWEIKHIKINNVDHVFLQYTGGGSQVTSTIIEIYRIENNSFIPVHQYSISDLTHLANEPIVDFCEYIFIYEATGFNLSTGFGKLTSINTVNGKTGDASIFIKLIAIIKCDQGQDTLLCPHC
jgi:hypothetical protein